MDLKDSQAQQLLSFLKRKHLYSAPVNRNAHINRSPTPDKTTVSDQVTGLENQPEKQNVLTHQPDIGPSVSPVEDVAEVVVDLLSEAETVVAAKKNHGYWLIPVLVIIVLVAVSLLCKLMSSDQPTQPTFKNLPAKQSLEVKPAAEVDPLPVILEEPKTDSVSTDAESDSNNEAELESSKPGLWIPPSD